jgi:hypothetical protein
MKAALKVKTLAWGGVLLFAALGSAATTLGRAQGALFVGQPLDLRIQLQFDGEADGVSGCVDADVYYGEAQVDPARVKVQLEPIVGGTTQAVRVLSSILINEPLVTVNLRVGCQQKSSRRYVLFPDVSSNVVEPVQRVPTLAAELNRARSTVRDTASPAQASAHPAAPAAAVPSIDKPRRPRQVSVAAPAERSAATAMSAQPLAPLPRQPRAVKSASKARLKLDPLDLLIERDPVLRASSELLAAPQEDPRKRAEATLLWRALNASPEDLMRDEAAAQRMEKDLKSLYAVTAENQKGLIDLVATVQRAQSERYANGLVYSLAALCLLSLLALGWIWRRLRAARAPSWMHGLEAGDSLLVELAQAPPVVRTGHTPLNEVASAPVALTAAPMDEPLVTGIADAAPELLTELDFDLDLMALSSHQPVPSMPSVVHAATAPRAQTPVRDFSVSVSAGLRAIDSEELEDVRQQADFFVSVGQHQKAIDVLTTRIAQVGESSPLVCLDLLKIYHALGRQSEFEFMRNEFDNWFTGRVPEFHAFSDEGHGLEHYRLVMDRIVAMWPDPSVLEYIENCLYHHSTHMEDPHFDLRAYRELLLLHGVAKRMVRLSDDESDSNLSELIRIPPRVHAATEGDAFSMPGSADLGHRAGAHHRSGLNRGFVAMPGRSVDVETRPAPLGVIKLPPDPTTGDHSESKSQRSKPDNVTDFNFLSLH